MTILASLILGALVGYIITRESLRVGFNKGYMQALRDLEERLGEDDV